VTSEFELTLGTDLAEIPRLADAFDAWAAAAGVAPADIHRVNVVLEELVTNAIVHGLGVGAPGRVRVRLWRDGQALGAELRDDAPPFDPFEIPPPSLTASLEEREIGGLGVHFVKTLMDEWGYARAGDENVVTLRKVLGRAPGARP
jgi:anti-sigma regulatory factor (Ser/Thr protein kinase)